ncbi:MAG: 5'-3' exonuclease [Frankia sp.]
MVDDRLLLLDAPSLYFRAFHGVPRSVVAPDGTPVNAVRGLIDVIARLVTEHRPSRLVACFDADWRPEFRVRALPSYKAHRVADDGGDGTPDELEPQLPIIDAVLEAFGVARSEAAGFEADDVIGTLATRHTSGPVDVVTGDRDLFQLVDDARGVRVLYAVEKFAAIDEAEIARRYAIPGRAYGDFAVLRGDPSDGLPGVPGIGPKSASALLTRFGSLENVLAAATGTDAGFPAGSRAKILSAREYIRPAIGVVQVVTDIDLPAFDDHLPASPRDPAAVATLAASWGLVSSCARLVTALTAAAG